MVGTLRSLEKVIDPEEDKVTLNSLDSAPGGMVRGLKSARVNLEYEKGLLYLLINVHYLGKVWIGDIIRPYYV